MMASIETLDSSMRLQCLLLLSNPSRLIVVGHRQLLGLLRKQEAAQLSEAPRKSGESKNLPTSICDMTKYTMEKLRKVNFMRSRNDMSSKCNCSDN